MGSNTIIAIVVGAVLVIVGFSLWPVLNGASNSLYSYFRNSCDDGSGNRFLRVYVDETARFSKVSLPLANGQHPALGSVYHTDEDVHGGSGSVLSGHNGRCRSTPFGTTEISNLRSGGNEYTDHTARYDFYNEQGELVGSHQFNQGEDGDGNGVIGSNSNERSPADVRYTSEGAFHWVEVAPMLNRFAGINNLLLTILPVVSVVGFLGISGAKLYSYGKGTASIGSSISTSVFTLIGIVVAMVIAGPILGSAVDANQVVVSGQYQVNTTFGNIIQLLFAMIPVIYIAGLVTLVGLQARSALMGAAHY